MQFFETIRIENGNPQHLAWHQERFNRTRRECFGLTQPLSIQSYLTKLPSRGLYRAKIIYDQNHVKTNYYIYKAKKITTLQCIETDITYRYKALDRHALESLGVHVKDADDILITQQGYLTDTTIANIALRQDSIWYTPATPLLAGTTRARLLHAGKLTLRDIHISDLPNYDGLALMNAMIGFREIKKDCILCH